MHPIAFQFGPLTVHWYGILLAVAFVVGFWTAGRRGLRDGLRPELFSDLGLCLVAGAILGARSLYVISYWQKDFDGEPLWKIFKIWEGGLVYYGGLIGATLAVIAYTQIKKLSLWKIADALSPSLALGYAIGRWGCLMTGCCYGRPTSLPWAICFPETHETKGVPVHPTQIYDSLLNFGLYLALAWLYRRKKFDGQVFAVYLVSYAFLRSFVELFRGDYPNYVGGWVTPAHWVSVGILVGGLLLFWRLPRRELKRG